MTRPRRSPTSPAWRTATASGSGRVCELVPKDTFERAYLPLETNKELRTGKPSISQEMVDNFILETWTQTAGEKTTIVRAMLRNGFELVEASSCVSPENYDEKLGREICMKKIKDRVWYLLGFLLQTAVNGVK